MLSRHHLMLFAAILTLALTAGTARADYLTGDPRKCPVTSSPQATPDKSGKCAYQAAKVTLLHYMRVHVNPSWSNPMTCTRATATSVLKWRCSFGTGTAVVWFRGTSTGWKRVVTVTMNP